MDPVLDVTLSALPPELASQVRDALAKEDRLRGQALVPAFQAAGFPEGPVYPLPESLTPTQRALAELAAHGISTPMRFALPWTRATARGWLGIDAPGPCEAIVEVARGGEKSTLPLWRAIQDLGADHKAVGQLLSKMTPSDAARTYVALARSAYRFDANGVLWYGGVDFLDRLGPEAAAWARNVAREWLDELGSGAHPGLYADVTRQVLAVAMARSGVPEDPRLDVLLPINFGTKTEVSVEYVRSLPEDRRLPAVLRALSVRQLPNVIIQHALALLEVLDAPEIVQVILEQSAQSDVPPKSVVKKALADLAKRKPGVKHAVEEARRSAPAPIVLRVTSIRRLRDVTELGPIEREQLRIAGKAWDGRDLSPDRRVGSSEEAFGGVLELRAFSDAAGSPRYDAWLYAGDSGSYFLAGSTTEIGGMIQGSVELNGPADAALRDALQEASLARATPARTAVTKKAAAKPRTSGPKKTKG